MSIIKPVTPAIAREHYEAGVDTPDFVIETVGDLILKHYHPNGFVLKREDIIVALLEKRKDAVREDVFYNKWLDFECFFRKLGWKVGYNSPDAGDDWADYYKFNE